MFSKSATEAHAAMLANQFANRVNDNLYAAALVDFSTVGNPTRSACKAVDDVSEIQALLDRYNAEFEKHLAEEKFALAA